jgi:hypothetical protein
MTGNSFARIEKSQCQTEHPLTVQPDKTSTHETLP